MRCSRWEERRVGTVGETGAGDGRWREAGLTRKRLRESRPQLDTGDDASGVLHVSLVSVKESTSVVVCVCVYHRLAQPRLQGDDRGLPVDWGFLTGDLSKEIARNHEDNEALPVGAAVRRPSGGLRKAGGGSPGPGGKRQAHECELSGSGAGRRGHHIHLVVCLWPPEKWLAGGLFAVK